MANEKKEAERVHATALDKLAKEKEQQAKEQSEKLAEATREWNETKKAL